jgi:UPF0271 protein
MKEQSSIYIFDANVFLTGIDFNVIEAEIYTSPQILEEVQDRRYVEKNRNIISKINVSIETKKLKIKLPESKYIKKIKDISRKTGDFNALSDADKEILALALELTERSTKNVKMYSNDYSIENVCFELKIPFSPLYKDGIEFKIIWEIYCPHCRKIHQAEDLNRVCENCGAKLRRRPKK